MTFSLTMSSSDLLLLLPEIFLTCWLCVLLIVDFSFPLLPKENQARHPSAPRRPATLK